MLLARIGADTAENEQNVAKLSRKKGQEHHGRYRGNNAEFDDISPNFEVWTDTELKYVNAVDSENI